MRRILYVTDSLMAGGTEQQLVELISHLDRRRVEPYVLCLYGAKTGRSLHFLPALQALHAPVILLDQHVKLWLIILIVWHVWRIRPNLIQTVNYHSSLLTRLARPFLPVTLKLIGCIYVEYTRKQLIYERLGAWLNEALVCNSSPIQQQLRSVLRWQSIEVIPNGIDVARFAAYRDRELRQRLAPDAEKILLFMGRISRQKSPHLVVEALGLLKKQGKLRDGVCLWIVGESVEKAAQGRLDQAICDEGLQAVVHQFSATDQPETFYAAADIVVVCSLWEGLPNVILESFAAGRSVIVSEAANHAGMVQAQHTGWIVNTGDVAQLAETIAISVDLPDSEVERMQVACREVALPYSSVAMADAFMALYARLIRYS